MSIIHSRPTVDLSRYARSVQKPEAYYGLPQSVQFCRRCVISNQRPSSVVEYKKTIEEKQMTIGFDDEGICNACRYHEVKEERIEWKKRETSLVELLDKHRRSDGGYDTHPTSSNTSMG